VDARSRDIGGNEGRDVFDCRSVAVESFDRLFSLPRDRRRLRELPFFSLVAVP
jgi:hypothetical protein